MASGNHLPNVLPPHRGSLSGLGPVGQVLFLPASGTTQLHHAYRQQLFGRDAVAVDTRGMGGVLGECLGLFQAPASREQPQSLWGCGHGGDGNGSQGGADPASVHSHSGGRCQTALPSGEHQAQPGYGAFDVFQAVYTGGEYVGLVYIDTTGAALYRIDVYDKKGNITLSQNIDIDYQNILIQKNSIVIYNNTECVMYSMKGKEKYRGTYFG